mgnify:CR=1 FL=1
MFPIAPFLNAGLRAAAMSGRSDGDCVLGRSSEAARRAFLAAQGLDPDRLVCPKQVHGVEVAIARKEDAGKGAFGPENALALADAVITNVPGLPIGITVADCVPVALYDPVRKAIGLAHAGREGTVQHIAAATVRAMTSAHGCDPAELLAYIGPSAGPCCYEVSEALAAAFTASGGPTQGRHLDLWQANRHQLRAAGLSDTNITVAGTCTICTDRFFSYRRENTPARNLMVLCL